MYMGKSTCDKFDLAEGRLKSFTRSAVRTKLMLCLIDGSKEAGVLEEAIGLRSTTILHSAKEMIDAGLIQKVDKGYALTNIGRIESTVLNTLVDCILALDRHHEFWMTHDLSGIPLDLQTKIGMLAESEVVASDQNAPLRSHEFFLSELSRSKEIYAASPVAFPGFSKAIADAVRRGARVDLILTEGILNAVEREQNDLLGDLRHRENFRLYTAGYELKAAFTITDSALSLGLFRQNGAYDLGNDLICTGETARAWGKELFDHYLARSMYSKGSSLPLVKERSPHQMSSTLI